MGSPPLLLLLPLPLVAVVLAMIARGGGWVGYELVFEESSKCFEG